MPVNITGIGSRETPSHILYEMLLIGKWCRANKIALRSGHAPGADIAFEYGALEYSRLYLPWKGFNSEYELRGPSKFIEDNPYTDIIDSIVNKYHPYSSNLKESTTLIMRRNVCQILGWTPKPAKPTLSRAVICWTKDGEDSGGTGMAMRVAKGFNVPIINMYKPEWNKAEYIINELKTLVK